MEDSRPPDKPAHPSVWNQPGFDPDKYEDGTNVLAGTDFIERTTRRTDWYLPSESKAPPMWEERWLTLRGRFERIVDNSRPAESILVQTRVPAYARDMANHPPQLDRAQLLRGGGGLRRELGQLFSKVKAWQPLIGAFAVRDATGKPMCNSANEPIALRFGLFRQIQLQVNFQYLSDPRPIPQPELVELSRDATGLLYQLPAEVAMKVWRNWLSGFPRGDNSNEDLWFDALFELAWQRQPGGPLHAKRMAWLGNSSFGLIGNGLFPRLLGPPGWPLLDKLPHENGYPMAYYSELRDVARASIGAIDEILALGRESAAKANSPSKTEERSSKLSTATSADVFISYSHKDDRWRKDLEKHLKPFVRAGSITAWSDKQIQSGSKWLPEIKAALAHAKVAVLLVTPDFLESDFIYQQELTPLLKEASKGGVRLLWVQVRACAYKETSLGEYQAVVSPPEKPLAQMKAERDAAWVRVCEEIKKAANP